MCCCDGDCRPLGFLLGLPFAFLSLLISIVGIIVWIVGYYIIIHLFLLTPLFSVPFFFLHIFFLNTLSLYDFFVFLGFLFCSILLSVICPCCLCVTVVVELALELIKAPIHVMEWFTSQIPC